MSMTNSPDPRPPEQLPTSAPNEAAGSDGSGTAAENVSHNAAEVEAASQISHSTSAPRDWSSLPELSDSHLRPRLRRRLFLPLVLFIATCLSTFWVGAAKWRPQSVQTSGDVRDKIVANWPTGLTYMGAVLAILLTHEM